MRVASFLLLDDLRVAVKVGGQVIAKDSSTLEAPLKPGYGFFAQVHLADYAAGKRAED